MLDYSFWNMTSLNIFSLGESMYESYFNLKTKPFDLLPNPDFLFLSKTHKRALAYLDYGINEGLGFILLTGEVGSGKTTIIRDMVKKCNDRVVLAKVFITSVDSKQLLAMINEEFGLSSTGKEKVELLRELNDFLIGLYGSGKRAALIIDEAQNLSAGLLEEIRMLSNLETDSGKLLQIILVGQPELRDIIAAPEMLQLRQRVSINCHLHPLSRPETEEYILHRLEVAGGQEAVTFTTEAFDLIYTFSRGIPRLINIICDFLMLSAFAEGKKVLDETMIKDITGDLDFERQYWGEKSVTGSKDVVQKTERGGQNMDAEFEKLSFLLQEIHNRLEALEKKTVQPDKDDVSEIKDKVTSLENAFRFHVKKTDSSVSVLSNKLEKITRTEADETMIAENSKLNKWGFVTRIFGK